MIITSNFFKSIYTYDYDVIQMFYLQNLKINVGFEKEIILIAYVKDQYNNADSSTKYNYLFFY